MATTAAAAGAAAGVTAPRARAMFRGSSNTKAAASSSSSSASRRRCATIRAAAPPAERKGGSAVATKPLVKQDLVDYIASGCKPKSAWRIGTEHEKFGYQLDNLKPIEYEKHVKVLLEALVTRFNWEPMIEGGFIIGAKLDGQSVTLEPGGQFELSGAPVENLHLTCAEVHSHLYQVKTVAQEIGVAFMGLGFQPKWSVADTPVMPKGRYKIMKEYMPKKGKRGLDMMFRTCTIQVNLDFSDERDMIRKFRTSLALQPIATALFANSPFCDGKPSGMKSLRSDVWTDTDPDRTGTLAWVWDEDFGFEKYADYVLDVPMYFMYRDGIYHDMTGQSFKSFMKGELPGFPGELPTLDDWEQHLTTCFPEVRLKRYIEMRGADGGPWSQICALPALWVGLLYDSQALDEAEALVADWTSAEREYLRTAVTKDGLQTPFRGGDIQAIAEKMVVISKEGLRRRKCNEENFVDGLMEIATSGKTSADRLLEAYETEWGGDIDKVFAKLTY